MALKGGMFMNTFYCELTLLNKEDWLQYATKILETNRNRNTDEILKDIVTFDFKFEVIPR